MEKEYSKFQATHQMDLESKAIQDPGLRIKWKVLENIIMLPGLFIKESGRTTNTTEKEYINSQTEQSMRENGRIT